MLSSEAINAARRQATELSTALPRFRKPAATTPPRTLPHRKLTKRSVPPVTSFRTPAQVSSQLSGDEFRLYELIWKRTIASQMIDATGYTATIAAGHLG